MRQLEYGAGGFRKSIWTSRELFPLIRGCKFVELPKKEQISTVRLRVRKKSTRVIFQKCPFTSRNVYCTICFHIVLKYLFRISQGQQYDLVRKYLERFPKQVQELERFPRENQLQDLERFPLQGDQVFQEDQVLPSVTVQDHLPGHLRLGQHSSCSHSWNFPFEISWNWILGS